MNNVAQSRAPSGSAWLALGYADLAQGIRDWRVSHLMGLNPIRRRYARSKIGQFWVTISTAIMVAALGLVWSALWRTPIDELLPFISISLILWGLITGTLGEAATVFVQSGPMYLNQGMSFSTAIYALIYRNLLIFAHNLPVVVATMIIFSVPLRATAILALPGFVFLVVTLLWLGYLVAIACVRFRDLTQVVQSGFAHCVLRYTHLVETRANTVSKPLFPASQSLCGPAGGCARASARSASLHLGLAHCGEPFRSAASCSRCR